MQKSTRLVNLKGKQQKYFQRQEVILNIFNDVDIQLYKFYSEVQTRLVFSKPNVNRLLL